MGFAGGNTCFVDRNWEILDNVHFCGDWFSKSDEVSISMPVIVWF